MPEILSININSLCTHNTLNCAESLDFLQLDNVFINFTYSNQDEEQCSNISEYIVNDGVAEETEYFILTLSWTTVQTSFPPDQLTFNRAVAQVFIEDDDDTCTTGKHET